MRTIRRTLVGLVSCVPAMLTGQVQPDTVAKARMRADVHVLASDSLGGRETATPFEWMAADYIMTQYRDAQLLPKGDDNTFLQAFTFAGPVQRGAKNTLQVGRSPLKLDEEFFPVSWSANATVFTRSAKCGYGINAPELGRNDFEGVEVKDHAAAFCISSPDGIHPHSKWLAYHSIGDRINAAIALGANAVLLYNDDPTADDLDSTLSLKITPCSVPVVFLRKKGFEKLGLDGNPVVVSVDIQRPDLVGHNVIGFQDNQRPNTVVIGAHYDHLGHGIEGSLYRGGEAIHNGADDNASGVAVMLQLARDLKAMPGTSNNNYLFIAFSGEELGLYGSNWWTKHPTVPISGLNYMINMDMVGRLDTSNTIAINGVGTSPAWSLLRPKEPVKGKRVKPDPKALKLTTTESGVGPSDHTSFYLQGVPAIHYFTGAHEDYHKPSDDEEKINYDGMVRVAHHIESLILALNDSTKLTFTKTAADTSAVPSFKVTLGVVPDYMYSGQGMRIDGVTDGKPASAAGLRPGDVVVKLGDHAVTDMMSYMKALGAFKKGDTTPVTVVRDGKEMKADITFK